MTRIVFLCSGGGGNFHFVRDCIAGGLLPDTSLLTMISDRVGPVTRWCERNGHPSRLVDFRQERQCETLLPALSHLDPDIVVTNISRIITPEIVRHFYGRMINLHYSLLPAYAGTTGFVAATGALFSGQKFCGVTVHYVSEELDGGRQIGQAAIPVLESDTQIEDLGNVVFRSGAMLLISAIAAALKGGHGWSERVFRVGGRKVMFNTPEPELAQRSDSEERWLRVKAATHA